MAESSKGDCSRDETRELETARGGRHAGIESMRAFGIERLNG